MDLQRVSTDESPWNRLNINTNRCMVILVFYVGYRRGLHFIYLFAVLIATNTVVVVFFQRVFILKKMEISGM